MLIPMKRMGTVEGEKIILKNSVFYLIKLECDIKEAVANLSGVERGVRIRNCSWHLRLNFQTGNTKDSNGT